MKNIFFLFFFAFIMNSIKSQDLIVTQEDDSLNCKITKVKSDNIYFTFIHQDEIRSTLLPVSQVKSHQFDFFQTSEVPKNKVIGFENYQKFRLALIGGFSYQTAKVSENIPEAFRDYVKELKSGYHFGGDISYYFMETMGFGAKYCMFKSSNSEDIYLQDMLGNRTYGKMSDDVSLVYIGPSFSTRLLNHDKSNAFFTNLSLGYMAYSNDKVMIDNYTMTGNTLGFAIDIGYDIGLSEKLSLGFQLSMISGSLFKFEWDDGNTIKTIELEEGQYESLNRIDFSIGLVYKL
jgi:hypothetical protein